MIQNVDFVWGEAGSTSTNGGNHPQHAFTGNLKKRWRSNLIENMITNPVVIWYDFKTDHIYPVAVSLGKIKSSWVPELPSKFEFIGSNDLVCGANADWFILCKTKEPLGNDKKWGCKLDENQIGLEKFRCLGLRIYAADEKRYVSLSNIQIEVYTGSRSSWKLRQTSIAYRPVFEEVEFIGGHAEASSVLGKNYASNGFDQKFPERFWHSQLGKLPYFIWYKFENLQVRPARISFHPRNHQKVNPTDDQTSQN